MDKYYVGLNKTFIKLKISKESTIVDEKNNRVIHIINWELEIPGLMDDFFWMMIKDCNTYKLRGKAKGVAVCHPEDKFDVEVGKKMARAIAESNAYHNAATMIGKRLYRLNKIVDQMNDVVIDFIAKATEIKLHNKEYQDSLIK